jgi:signal transduction histidine kinase
MDQAERRTYDDTSRIEPPRRRRPHVHPAAPSRQALEGEVVRLAGRVEELERELEESREQSARLERFAAMAAHEVLKPLVMTEAFATMIAERGGHGLDLDTRRDVDTLIRISSRMRVLVEALLMDARPDREELLQRQAVDVSKVLNDCVDMLGAEIRARDVKVEVDPMPVVPGDAAMLTGVFGNLLSNALQYGPREGCAIQVSAERSEAGWTFSVESPGPPIPELDRQRIFEPWQRGWGERRARGVGLGLAIVRQVVERHGGQVGVSTPSSAAGNRFFFTLPA